MQPKKKLMTELKLMKREEMPELRPMIKLCKMNKTGKLQPVMEEKQLWRMPQRFNVRRMLALTLSHLFLLPLLLLQNSQIL